MLRLVADHDSAGPGPNGPAHRAWATHSRVQRGERNPMSVSASGGQELVRQDEILRRSRVAADDRFLVVDPEGEYGGRRGRHGRDRGRCRPPGPGPTPAPGHRPGRLPGNAVGQVATRLAPRRHILPACEVTVRCPLGVGARSVGLSAGLSHSGLHRRGSRPRIACCPTKSGFCDAFVGPLPRDGSAGRDDPAGGRVRRPREPSRGRPHARRRADRDPRVRRADGGLASAGRRRPAAVGHGGGAGPARGSSLGRAGLRLRRRRAL